MKTNNKWLERRIKREPFFLGCSNLEHAKGYFYDKGLVWSVRVPLESSFESWRLE